MSWPVILMGREGILDNQTAGKRGTQRRIDGVFSLLSIELRAGSIHTGNSIAGGSLRGFLAIAHGLEPANESVKPHFPFWAQW